MINVLFLVLGQMGEKMDILLKRAEAIKEVKEKLEIYTDIMLNGYVTICERIPSTSTSILAMSEGTHSNFGLGKKTQEQL